MIARFFIRLLARLLRFLGPKIGPRAMVSIPLLLIILGSVSSGLGEVIRGLADEQLWLYWWSLIALVLGWQLAGKAQKRWRSAVAIIIGIPIIFMASGHLAGLALPPVRAAYIYLSEHTSLLVAHWLK